MANIINGLGEIPKKIYDDVHGCKTWKELFGVYSTARMSVRRKLKQFDFSGKYLQNRKSTVKILSFLQFSIYFITLALEITINDDDTESISGIWDYCEDEEGILYDIANSDDERKSAFKIKKEFIENEFSKRNEKRKQILGFDIEPIE